MKKKALLDAFAEKFPVGMTVHYHPVVGQPEFRTTVIRSLPWRLDSGHLVVKVEGMAGGVSCDAITAAEQPNDEDPPTHILNALDLWS